MSFDDTRLGFFPTPYPDEILYSVLCRYHTRSGQPAVYQTNNDLWGRNIGGSFLLPCGIKQIAGKIPPKSKLTAKRFISKNTIFPFLKPFVPQERGELLIKTMENGTSGRTNAFNLLGLPHLRYSKQLYLRYCPQCMAEDIETHGEAYWHRLHQLPGIFACPRHGTPIIETDILISSLSGEFHPAAPNPVQTEPQFYIDDVTEKLKVLAYDAKWLLENGNKLDYYEATTALYDKWLRAKGFRGWNGKTWHKKLYSAIVIFYGQELLLFLEAFDTGITPWSRRLLQHQNSLVYPIYHILLMRFLAGSSKAFFQGNCDMPLPFGNPPWPCRNKICEHHLKDAPGKAVVIAKMSVELDAV